MAPVARYRSRVARTAALVVVFTVLLVGSSASAATEVAVPGTSVFRWPSMTWSSSTLSRYATVVVCAVVGVDGEVGEPVDTGVGVQGADGSGR